MTPEGWRHLVLNSVRKYQSGDSVALDLLVRMLVEMDQAKQLLRDKGFGWIGLSLLETVRSEVPNSDDSACEQNGENTTP